MSDDPQFSRDWFSSPGDSIRHLMTKRRLTPGHVSEHMAGGEQELRGLLDGTMAVDQKKAAALASVLGGTPAFWIKRQVNYDAALEQAVTNVLVDEVDEWLAQVPVPRSGRKRSSQHAQRRKDVRRRLVFYNVNNLHAWTARYRQFDDGTLFRSTRAFTTDDGATAMWLRQGELAADMVHTMPWSTKALRDRVPAIRELSRIGRPSRFLPRLRLLCAEAGVALVVVPPPRGCRASGASRMVSAEKAMLMVSFRHRTDDQFWFTIFHEVGHLVLHDAMTFVDDDETSVSSQYEREANDFAAQCIVPDHRGRDLLRLRHNQRSITRLAVSLGVSPGLVVGQLQHKGLVDFGQLNYLKRHWSWDDINVES